MYKRNFISNFFDIFKFYFYAFLIIGSYAPMSENTTSQISLLYLPNMKQTIAQVNIRLIGLRQMESDMSTDIFGIHYYTCTISLKLIYIYTSILWTFMLLLFCKHDAVALNFGCIILLNLYLFLSD
jgi:hypothetical protein